MDVRNRPLSSISWRGVKPNSKRSYGLVAHLSTRTARSRAIGRTAATLCAIRVRSGHSDDPPCAAYALVCRDGPVFPAGNVLW